MRPFRYIVAASLNDALQAMDGSTRPLAGGTDLVTLMKPGLAAPERLVAIRRLLPSGITEETEVVALGAGTTLSEIENHALLRRRFSALSQAAALAATPQLRNMATLGGNLLQRPRCWYFRNPHIGCWLKGGERCPARDGENREHALFGAGPCVAVHPSDLAPALLAFDAYVRLGSRRGERILPLEAFFALPADQSRRETTLRDDELVLGVDMPSHPEETRSLYLKAMDRQAFSFALVGVAAVLRLSPSGRIGHARLVLSGVAPIPWRAQAAERVLLSSHLDERVVQKAAEAAMEGAEPLRLNGWKVPLAKALVKRALETLGAA